MGPAGLLSEPVIYCPALILGLNSNWVMIGYHPCSPTVLLCTAQSTYASTSHSQLHASSSYQACRQQACRRVLP